MKSPIKALVITLFILLLVPTVIIPIRWPVPFITPVKGIDISHHQSRIEWGKVQEDRVQFAYIKASEGGDFRDSLFHINWKESQEADVVVGAYHFLTFCKSGKEQAQNFMNAVGEFKSSQLIPMIDIEYGGNCKKRLNQEELLALVDEFTEELQTQSKNPPVIYMTHDIYLDYFKGRELPHKIWIRAIATSPRRSFNRNWDIWQYFHRGTVAGINGPVDLNVLKEKSVESLLNI